MCGCVHICVCVHVGGAFQLGNGSDPADAVGGENVNPHMPLIKEENIVLVTINYRCLGVQACMFV